MAEEREVLGKVWNKGRKEVYIFFPTPSLAGYGDIFSQPSKIH
jgi:hypothetical protein